MITARLSIMMFLQFFVWGAWFVTLGPYMAGLVFNVEDSDINHVANAYSTAPIAAILSPLLLGIVADRFFPGQIVMGMLHILGGVLLVIAPIVAGPEEPWLFVSLLLAHMVCYMPTLGLSSAVAFNAISQSGGDSAKQFPLIRVWGTVGWIVAGFAITYAAGFMHPASSYTSDEGTVLENAMALARQTDPTFFYIAGGAAVALGLFSFTLPNTPPSMKGKPFDIGAALGLDALKLLAKPAFAVFIAGSMLLCIPLAAYYQQAATFAGDAGVSSVPIRMTYGQMSEVLFMLAMPLALKTFGIKWTLAIGMLAWVLRYGLFAGAWEAGAGEAAFWLVIGGIVLHGICYDFFFVTGQIYTEQTAPPEIRSQAQGFLVLVTQGVGMLIGAQVVGQIVTRTTADGVTDWTTVWAIPAVFALVILVLFVVLFRDKDAASASQIDEA
ncbi:MAG: MFS transporter [Planctomycetota bacterium]